MTLCELLSMKALTYQEHIAGGRYLASLPQQLQQVVELAMQIAAHLRHPRVGCCYCCCGAACLYTHTYRHRCTQQAQVGFFHTYFRNLQNSKRRAQEYVDYTQGEQVDSTLQSWPGDSVPCCTHP